MTDPTRYPLLANPHIRLYGPVDYNMYSYFRSCLESAADGDLVIAITTLGGDPEVARAMGDDVRLLSQQYGRNLIFLGKVAVYSAGATFMSYFRRENRFLTHGTRLMLHERQITRTISLSGPLRDCVSQLKAALNEIEESIRIEEEGFANIVNQSDVPFEELRERARENWYIEAEQARTLGLVLDVI